MGFSACPLTPDRWDDLVAVFGGGEGRGECGRCWCMWWRLPRTGPGFAGERDVKALFRDRVAAGPPPGLVGYQDQVPVAWMQIGPRADVPEWNKTGRLTAPLDAGDAVDRAVWGISCFVTRTGYRKNGHSGALLAAGLAWAAEASARVVDACPVDPAGRKKSASGLYHGVASVFRAQGFVELARRKADRPLMRRVLVGHGDTSAPG